MLKGLFTDCVVYDWFKLFGVKCDILNSTNGCPYSAKACLVYSKLFVWLFMMLIIYK